MGKNIIKKICSATMLCFIISYTMIAGAVSLCVPDSVSVYNACDIADSFGLPFVSLDFSSGAVAASTRGGFVSTYPAQAVAFGSITVRKVNVNVFDRLSLIPGGMTFGVNLHTDGVVIVGMSDVPTPEGQVNPAYKSGLRVRDVITAVNGKPVAGASDVTDVLDKCDGEPVTFTVKRGDETLDFTFTPVYVKADDCYKAGIWIRDGASGIGTVTYIDPSDNTFGGLGHSICDADTGEPLPLAYGTVYGVTLTSITPGEAGSPGELSGYFSSERTGALTANTDNGVFGIFNTLPTPIMSAIPIALRSEVKAGEATLLSTDGNNGIREYSIVISGIDSGGHDNRNFIVEVTDPDLIALTGGIVQGMSGSPIIQNGKLVGAVTHVLINNPKRGYGIFIENMLLSEADDNKAA